MAAPICVRNLLCLQVKILGVRPSLCKEREGFTPLPELPGKPASSEPPVVGLLQFLLVSCPSRAPGRAHTASQCPVIQNLCFSPVTVLNRRLFCLLGHLVQLPSALESITLDPPK